MKILKLVSPLCIYYPPEKLGRIGCDFSAWQASKLLEYEWDIVLDEFNEMGTFLIHRI